MNGPDVQDRSSELLQLMMKYQRRIFAYINTLVPSRSDAEDILQETSLTICENFLTSKQVLISTLGLVKLHTGRLGLQEKSLQLPRLFSIRKS